MASFERKLASLLHDLVNQRVESIVHECLPESLAARCQLLGVGRRLEEIDFSHDANSLLACIVNNQTFSARVREIALYTIQGELPALVEEQVRARVTSEVVGSLVAAAVSDELASPECQEVIRERVRERLRGSLNEIVGSVLGFGVAANGAKPS